MPRSKGTRRRQQSRRHNQEARRTEIHSGWVRRRVQEAANHPIALTAGLFVTALAIWQFVLPAFAAPEIEVSDSDPASPFVFPFYIRDQSWAFDMQDVVLVCDLVHLEAGPITIKNAAITMGVPRYIVAGQSDDYRCPMMNPGVPIKALTMNVTLKFRTLYVWKRTYSKSFFWVVDGEHSRWIEGGRVL